MTQGAEFCPLWKTCLTARSLSPTYWRDKESVWYHESSFVISQVRSSYYHIYMVAGAS